MINTTHILEYFKELISNEKCNYIEIVVFKQDQPNVYIDLNHDLQYFKHLLQNLNKDKYKFFKKESVKYFHNELQLIKNANNSKCYKEENVYIFETLESKSLVLKHFNLMIMAYNKIMYPLHLFPSGNKINDILNINRMSTKINNVLYLNFEITENIQEDTQNIIYFNYNDSKHNDLEHTCDLLHNTLNDLILYSDDS